MNKMNSKYFRFNCANTIFIFLLALYAVSYFSHFNIGSGISGIPLLFFFPGLFLLDLLRPVRRLLGSFGRFSLSVMLSLGLSAVCSIVIQNTYGFNSSNQILAIILVNVVLFIASLIARIISTDREEELQTNYPISWKHFVPAIILVLAIIAVLLFNPLPQNLDNYFNILKLSIAQNNNMLQVRKIFISLLGLTNQFSKIDVFYIYEYLFLSLFVASTLTFCDFLVRNIKSQKIAVLLYLSILISPAILTEVNRLMPQVVLVILTMPTLILTIEAIKNKRISASISALALSLVASIFHELGAILALVALISLLINLWQLIIIDKKISWKKLIFPIILLIALGIIYQSSVVVPLIQRPIYRIHEGIKFQSEHGGIYWRWWFLNNYKTVEDIQLGWTGIGALLYYLYGGVLLFIPLVSLSYLAIRQKFRVDLASIPTIIYFLFFLGAAELFPRLNLAFLPNRAWVHMMLPVVIIVALLYQKLETSKVKLKYIEILFATIIIIGFSGTLYLAKKNIYTVYPAEIKAAQFIKNSTPGNAIIISSQDNMSLVNVYANRPYGQINTDHVIDRDEFDKLISQEIERLSLEPSTGYNPGLLQAPMQYITKPGQVNVVTIPPYSGGNTIYFLYSYAKTGGLNNQREYRKSVVDSVNKSTYDQLGYEIVYSDQNTLLIKVK